jgi:hypothetical protein
MWLQLDEKIFDQAVSAEQKSTNKRVAMKVFGYMNKPNSDAIEREIQLMTTMEGVTGVVQYIGTFNDSQEGYSEYINITPTWLTCYNYSHHTKWKKGQQKVQRKLPCDCDGNIGRRKHLRYHRGPE